MKAKKALSVILAALMLSSVVSCSESKTNTDETQAQAESTESVDNSTESVETEAETEERLKPDIPESADFGGDEIRFLFWEVSDWKGTARECRDIFSEGLNGEGINDAVFNRNTKIEENYKVKIALDILPYNTIVNEINTCVQGGDETYDVVYCRLVEAPGLFNHGTLYNLKEVPHLDFDKPWWDAASVRSLTIKNFLPCVATSINVNDKDATAAMVFNKEMLASNQLESPYELVRNGKWTIDKLTELGDTVDNDSNGDGKMDRNDIYGFMGQSDVMESFFYGIGSQHSAKDENGELYFSFGSERDITATQKIIDMMNQPWFFNGKNFGMTSLTMRDMFDSGHGLFFWIRLEQVTNMRTGDTDFGVLPIPKYEEEQDNYYSMVSRHTTGLLSVPITIGGEKLEQLGVVLEAMAAESHYTVLPEYIETSLKTKYSRDSESADMFDIILSSRVFDPLYIYNFGGYADAFLVLGDKANSNISSFIKSKQKVVEKNMAKAMEKFAD